MQVEILPDGLEALRREMSLPEIMRLIERTARRVDRETFDYLPVWYPRHVDGKHSTLLRLAELFLLVILIVGEAMISISARSGSGPAGQLAQPAFAATTASSHTFAMVASPPVQRRHAGCRLARSKLEFVSTDLATARPISCRTDLRSELPST